MSIILAIKTNPLWRIKGLVTHRDSAHAQTLWQWDSNGMTSPATMPNGQPRSITEGERLDMLSYNAQRAQLNQANRNAVDAIMGRFFPISDVAYNQISDAASVQFVSDASWLADHEQGSEFYNNPNNYVGLPGIEFDYQADYLWARFHNRLVETCLAIDYSQVETKVSEGVSTPIVIDLDNDGIETTSFLAGPSVLFDIDGDGIKDRTAWLSGKDAFLAVDHNGNGTIDGVNELFGGPNRADGFARLVEFDSNGDGIVDHNDDRFSELMLWTDANVDGVTDAGELIFASAAGLESISTDYISQEVTNNGNLFGEVSIAVHQGQETSAVDVYFRFNAGTAPVALHNDAQVGSLISAMASFSAPSLGSLSPQAFADLQQHLTLPTVTSGSIA